MPFHTEVIVVLMVFVTVEIAVEIAVQTFACLPNDTSAISFFRLPIVTYLPKL